MAEIVIGIATAVFIGGRFLPPRFRLPVGVTLTACYVIAVVAFIIFVLSR